MTRRFPDLETLAWTILAGGLLLSITLILTGLAWEWIDTRTLNMGPPLIAANLWGFLVSTIAGSVQGLSPSVLLNVGIAFLLLTPYTLVLASMCFFAVRDHDYRFTAVTAFVATVLTWVLFIR
jgi:uncharacterized membrane protein